MSFYFKRKLELNISWYSFLKQDDRFSTNDQMFLKYSRACLRPLRLLFEKQSGNLVDWNVDGGL